MSEVIEPGEVIQLSPDPGVTTNPAFAGCLAIVDESKSWGVQCYVQGLGTREGGPGGQAYYRAATGTFARLGAFAKWTIGDIKDRPDPPQRTA